MYPPLTDDDWPEALAHLRGFTASANVYRTMAHHPALLAAWGPLRAHIVTKSALPPAALEAVIIRTGHRRGAAYERAHHIVRGRAAGLDDARIAALEGPLSAIAEPDATLARAVDALIDGNVLPEALQAAITARHGTGGLFDLIATVGFYTTLAYVVKSFATPLDDDIARELAARPLAP